MVTRCVTCALAASLFATFARADEVQIDVPLLKSGFDPIPLNGWRIGALELRDPHVYYSIGVCLDVTDTLNTNLQQQLDADSNGDGIYDSSALELMLPYQNGAVNAFGSSDGNCTTGATPQCTPGTLPRSGRWYEAFNVTAPTVCLGALPGTTSDYTPPVPEPSGHCFATTSLDTTVALGTLSIPLWDTQLAAPWPATTGSTSGGLMRGFLREADADQITVDLGTGPVVLSSVLPGGTGSCATGVTNGLDNDRNEPGWWMYLEYRLDAVTTTGF
jgi:hypothetical protein